MRALLQDCDARESSLALKRAGVLSSLARWAEAQSRQQFTVVSDVRRIPPIEGQ